MNPALSLLDQAELMQFALAAGASGDGATAMGYLKEAATRSDATAPVHYLLGAEYAQCGMYDRAIESMEAALALDPGLDTARIQLALLLLGANAPGNARLVLEPLASLPAAQALGEFGRGLIALIDDQLPAATAHLSAGIGLNTVNPALNADMQRIIEAIAKLPAATEPAPESVPEEETQQPASEDLRHLFLSAYTGKSKI